MGDAVILRFTVVCEDAPSRVVTVERARVHGSVAVCGELDVWRASCDDADLHWSTRTADGDTPREAVTWLAVLRGWEVAAVLGPGDLSAQEREAAAYRRGVEAAARACDERVKHLEHLASEAKGREHYRAAAVAEERADEAALLARDVRALPVDTEVR